MLRLTFAGVLLASIICCVPAIRAQDSNCQSGGCSSCCSEGVKKHKKSTSDTTPVPSAPSSGTSTNAPAK